MTLRAKVLVVGPGQCGKTRLCNFWADVANDQTQTTPTKGCRILEFNPEVGAQGQRASDLTIELWDVSGDNRYQSGWPAIAHGAQAAIVVVDANKTPSESALEPWFKTFVKGAGIKSAQCIVVALRSDPSQSLLEACAIPGPLSKATLVMSDLSAEPEALRAELCKFTEQIRAAAVKAREQEESKVLNNAALR